jgi:phosphonate transport system permease protein
MPLVERGELKIWQRRERGRQLAIWLVWLMGVALFVLCCQMISATTMWRFVWDSTRIASEIGARMLPPLW